MSAPETTPTAEEMLNMAMENSVRDAGTIGGLALENLRLRRAVAYARARMKQAAYVERMDKIVSGELDAEYANADFTPMTGGCRG